MADFNRNVLIRDWSGVNFLKIILIVTKGLVPPMRKFSTYLVKFTCFSWKLWWFFCLFTRVCHSCHCCSLSVTTLHAACGLHPWCPVFWRWLHRSPLWLLSSPLCRWSSCNVTAVVGSLDALQSTTPRREGLVKRHISFFSFHLIENFPYNRFRKRIWDTGTSVTECCHFSPILLLEMKAEIKSFKQILIVVCMKYTLLSLEYKNVRSCSNLILSIQCDFLLLPPTYALSSNTKHFLFSFLMSADLLHVCE